MSLGGQLGQGGGGAVSPPQHPLTLEFLNAALEAEYAQHYDTYVVLKVWRTARLLCVLFLVLGALQAASDWCGGVVLGGRLAAAAVAAVAGTSLLHRLEQSIRGQGEFAAVGACCDWGAELSALMLLYMTMSSISLITDMSAFIVCEQVSMHRVEQELRISFMERRSTFAQRAQRDALIQSILPVVVTNALKTGGGGGTSERAATAASGSRHGSTSTVATSPTRRPLFINTATAAAGVDGGAAGRRNTDRSSSSPSRADMGRARSRLNDLEAGMIQAATAAAAHMDVQEEETRTPAPTTTAPTGQQTATVTGGSGSNADVPERRSSGGSGGGSANECPSSPSVSLSLSQPRSLAMDSSSPESLASLASSLYARRQRYHGSAMYYPSVTVLFCILSDFTNQCSKVDTKQVVHMLNRIYSIFDAASHVTDCFKVENVADTFMAVCGCPERNEQHAVHIARLAVLLQRITTASNWRWPSGERLQIQIGIHTGAVVGGTIGRKTLSYHLFGDTVNTSSRMCTSAVPGSIQLSPQCVQALTGGRASSFGDEFSLKTRGETMIKGKGMICTSWLMASAMADELLPVLFRMLEARNTRIYSPPTAHHELQTPDAFLTRVVLDRSSLQFALLQRASEQQRHQQQLAQEQPLESARNPVHPAAGLGIDASAPVVSGREEVAPQTPVQAPRARHSPDTTISTNTTASVDSGSTEDSIARARRRRMDTREKRQLKALEQDFVQTLASRTYSSAWLTTNVAVVVLALMCYVGLFYESPAWDRNLVLVLRLLLLLSVTAAMVRELRYPNAPFPEGGIIAAKVDRALLRLKAWLLGRAKVKDAQAALEAHHQQQLHSTPSPRGARSSPRRSAETGSPRQQLAFEDAGPQGLQQRLDSRRPFVSEGGDATGVVEPRDGLQNDSSVLSEDADASASALSQGFMTDEEMDGVGPAMALQVRRTLEQARAAAAAAAAAAGTPMQGVHGHGQGQGVVHGAAAAVPAASEWPRLPHIPEQGLPRGMQDQRPPHRSRSIHHVPSSGGSGSGGNGSVPAASGTVLARIRTLARAASLDSPSSQGSRGVGSTPASSVHQTPPFAARGRIDNHDGDDAGGSAGPRRRSSIQSLLRRATPTVSPDERRDEELGLNSAVPGVISPEPVSHRGVGSSFVDESKADDTPVRQEQEEKGEPDTEDRINDGESSRREPRSLHRAAATCVGSLFPCCSESGGHDGEQTPSATRKKESTRDRREEDESEMQHESRTSLTDNLSFLQVVSCVLIVLWAAVDHASLCLAGLSSDPSSGSTGGMGLRDAAHANRCDQVLVGPTIVYSVVGVLLLRSQFRQSVWITGCIFCSVLFWILASVIVTHFDTEAGDGRNEIRENLRMVTALFVIVFAQAVTLRYCYDRERGLRVDYLGEQELLEENHRCEQLLSNMVPQPWHAQRLMDGELVFEELPDVTLFFSDLVGFTPLSATMHPAELCQLLHEIYSAFDRLLEKYSLYKVDTIGDAYVAVGGMPNVSLPGSNHTVDVIKFALDTIDALNAICRRREISVQMRIGVHAGRALGGVVSFDKPRYLLWGPDTVVANKMESCGIPGHVTVSLEARNRVTWQEEYHHEIRFSERTGRSALESGGEARDDSSVAPDGPLESPVKLQSSSVLAHAVPSPKSPSSTASDAYATYRKLLGFTRRAFVVQRVPEEVDTPSSIHSSPSHRLDTLAARHALRANLVAVMASVPDNGDEDEEDGDGDDEDEGGGVGGEEDDADDANGGREDSSPRAVVPSTVETV